MRSALPDDVALMADFNQALSYSAAGRVCRRLDDEGLEWIEEPIRHDDYAGAASLRAQLRTPLQIGENFAGIHPMVAALAHGASDFVMPDLDRIGGVTGWTRAATLAEASGVRCRATSTPRSPRTSWRQRPPRTGSSTSTGLHPCWPSRCR